MRFPLTLGAALALAALAGGCDGTASVGNASSYLAAQISTLDNYFAPDQQTISLGGIVRWVWEGNVPHDVVFVVAGAPANCPLQTSGICERGFANPGVFDYICTVHSGMNGRITVNP